MDLLTFLRENLRTHQVPICRPALRSIQDDDYSFAGPTSRSIGVGIGHNGLEELPHLAWC